VSIGAIVLQVPRRRRPRRGRRCGWLAVPPAGAGRNASLSLTAPATGRCRRVALTVRESRARTDGDRRPRLRGRARRAGDARGLGCREGARVAALGRRGLVGPFGPRLLRSGLPACSLGRGGAVVRARGFVFRRAGRGVRRGGLLLRARLLGLAAPFAGARALRAELLQAASSSTESAAALALHSGSGEPLEQLLAADAGSLGALV